MLPKSSRSAHFLSNAISRMLLQATDTLPKSAIRLKSILTMRMKSQSMEQPTAENRFRSPTKTAESSARLECLQSERKTVMLQPLKANSRLSALQSTRQPWWRCTILSLKSLSIRSKQIAFSSLNRALPICSHQITFRLTPKFSSRIPLQRHR